MPSVEKYIRKNSGGIDDAKDVFHDALLNFILKVKEGNKEINDIKGYLFIASKNLWITKARRAQKFSNTEVVVETATNNESRDFLEEEEKRNMMEEILTSLGERCKELLKLTFYMDYSLKEAAEILGFSSDEVAKTTQYRCKKKLFERVKNNKALIEHYY